MILWLPSSIPIVFVIDLTKDLLINGSGAPSSFSVVFLIDRVTGLLTNDPRAPQPHFLLYSLLI